MHARVGGVAELAEDHAARRRGGELVGRFLRQAHPARSRRADDVRAEGAHERDLFAGKFFGDDEDDAVAAAEGGEGDADAGVAGGAFEDGAARPERAAAFGVRDHGAADAVFDAAAGIGEFEFGVESGVPFGAVSCEAHEGGRADQVGIGLVEHGRDGWGGRDGGAVGQRGNRRRSTPSLRSASVAGGA